MRYIDFHVHAYPDKIAEKAVSSLESIYCGAGIFSGAHNRGTAAELHSDLIKHGIDKAVLLPAATKPAQPHSINTWVSELISSPLNSDGRIIPFGACHPDDPDVIAELDRVHAMGMKGIKLHPEATGICADDSRMEKIYRRCSELGLMIVFHAGPDPASADPSVKHSTPEMLAWVAEKYPSLTIAAAHMGGEGEYEDTEKYLCGRTNVYLDTACTAGIIPPETFVRLVRKHSADRVLFGSDMPWHTPSDEREMIEKSALTDEEKAAIFYKNAEKLLA